MWLCFGCCKDNESDEEETLPPEANRKACDASQNKTSKRKTQIEPRERTGPVYRKPVYIFSKNIDEGRKAHRLRRSVSPNRRNFHRKNPPVKWPQEMESKLGEWISETKKELCICMYTLTSSDIYDKIKSLVERGVLVKFIYDVSKDEGIENDNNKIPDLIKISKQRKNLDIRSLGRSGSKTDKRKILNHHKFAVRDRSQVVNGSANWTIQAFRYNYEVIMFDLNEESGVLFKEHFDELWELSNPSV